MFCGNCGNKLNDDSRFCSNCGMSVARDEKTIISDQHVDKRLLDNKIQKPKEKQIDGFLIFSIVAALLIVLSMLTTNIFEFECRYKNYKDEKVETSGICLLAENEVTEQHRYSKESEKALKDVAAALGMAFSFLVVIEVAVVMLTFKNKYGWIMSLQTTALFVVIYLGMFVSSYWDKVGGKAGEYKCVHKINMSQGFVVICIAIILHIIFSLYKYFKKGEENN